MTMPDGVRLDLPGGGTPLAALADVNAALAPVGARLSPLGLAGVPADLRQLLKRTSLTEAEAKRLETHFLLPRTRLLELIKAAGRKPQVCCGGALATQHAPDGATYPRLYRVERGIDHSRFDRFHVNVADDGTGVDEVMQILAGSGVRFLQRAPGGGVLALQLDCPEDAGWILTYRGACPHIGSISGASAGTKVLMQIIGPARWVMRYV